MEVKKFAIADSMFKLYTAINFTGMYFDENDERIWNLERELKLVGIEIPKELGFTMLVKQSLLVKWLSERDKVVISEKELSGETISGRKIEVFEPEHFIDEEDVLPPLNELRRNRKIEDFLNIAMDNDTDPEREQLLWVFISGFGASTCFRSETESSLNIKFPKFVEWREKGPVLRTIEI